MRDRIEALLEAWGHRAYRNARVVIAAAVVVTGLAASLLPRLAIDTSTEGFFDEKNPIRVEYEAFRARFGMDSRILIALRPMEIYELEFLETLRALHEELEAEVPLLVEITSLINARETRGEGERLIVGELLEDWPEDEAAVADLKRRVEANPLYRDQLVSANGRLTTIVIETEAYTQTGTRDDELGGFDEPSEPSSAEPAFLTGEEEAAIVDAVAAIVERYRTPELEILVAGTQVMNVAMSRTMLSDMSRATSLALAAIALLLALAFRRSAGVVLPLLTVVVSVILTMAVMATAGIAITAPTQILPTFLLSVGVGASVHIMAIFYQGRRAGLDKEGAIAHALGHSGLAVAMTSVTTAGGLLSFIAADLAPIADFGMMGPVGVIAALLVTLILLPALVAIYPMREEERLEGDTPKLSQRLVVRAGAYATRHAGLTVSIWIVLIATSALGIAQIRLSHAPYEWFPPGHPTRVAGDTINTEMAGSLYVEFVVDAHRENGIQAPALLQGLEQFEKRARRLQRGEMFVGKTTSVSDVVQEIHQALNENRPEFHAVPDDPRLVAQELLLFENSGSDDLEELVDPQFRVARVSVKLPFLDAVEFAPMYDDLRSTMTESLPEGTSYTLTGLGILAGETINVVMRSLVRSYAIAFAVICPLLVLLIGRIRLGLAAIVPNLAPVLITLGVMGWAGLPLDSFTMMVGSIALGLAVDDTIHFMHNFRRYFDRRGEVEWAVRETLRTTGQALLFTTLVLASGFSLYATSTLTVLPAFGLLTALCLVLALLADVLLAPALMVLVSRRQPASAGGTIPMEAPR